MLPKFLNRDKHKHPSYLSFAKGGLGMMLNPEGTQSVFDIEDGLLKSKSTDELLRFTIKDAEVQAMIRQRYLQPIPDIEALRKMPKGSLGYQYFYHLDSHGYDPDYYRKIDVQNDVDYVMMRIRQTHDIWHVVTGFDTHPLGEIAVKAVELAQTHRPMAAAICAGGVFRYMLKEPEYFAACLESIVAGYQMGLQSRPLLSMKWEQLWERNVNDLREQLGVVPVGPRGGKLTVEFKPQNTEAAQTAVFQSLKDMPVSSEQPLPNGGKHNDHQ